MIQFAVNINPVRQVRPRFTPPAGTGERPLAAIAVKEASSRGSNAPSITRLQSRYPAHIAEAMGTFTLERLGCTDIEMGIAHCGSFFRHTTAHTKVKKDVDFYSFLLDAGYTAAQLRRYGNAQLRHNIVYKNLNYYAPKKVSFDEEILRKAIGFADRHFGPFMQGVGMATMTEAIQNLEESKSPGYPWNLRYTDQGAFLDSEDAGYLSQHWDDLVNEQGPWSIWASSIKDELRPIEKVITGSSRVIHGAAVEMKVSLNRYCLKQNEAFYASHLKTFSAVGINPYSGGWDRVYKKLSAHLRGFALDEVHYDTSLHSVLMYGVRDLRWGWLGLPEESEHRTRFHNLYEDVVHSRLITPLGDIFGKAGGNPSGSPNTVVDNTIALFILLAYAFIQTTGGAYSDFVSLVEALLYGDDNTLTVDESIIDVFNGRSIKRSMEEFGVEVKDKDLDPRPLDELDFLKKKFVDVGGMKVFCPVDPEKHLHSLLIRSKGTVVERLARACAVRQLVFFSPVFPVVDDWCKHLIKTYNGPQTLEWKNAVAQYLTPRQIAASYMIPMESCIFEDLAMDTMEALWKSGGSLKENLLNMAQQQQQQQQPAAKRRNRARAQRRRAPASRRATASIVIDNFPHDADVPITLADLGLQTLGNSVRLISARISIAVTSDGAGAFTVRAGSYIADELNQVVVGSGPFVGAAQPLLTLRGHVLGRDPDNERTAGGTLTATVEYSDRALP
jgi:hypothetical protein